VDLLDAVCLMPIWLHHDDTLHTAHQGYNSTERWPFGDRRPSVCEVQAVFMVFAETSSFCWTAAVSVFLYLDNRAEPNQGCCAGFSPREQYGRFITVSALVAFGYPLAISLSVWRWAVLGAPVDGGPQWCFILQNQPHGTLWRIAADYGPIWASLVVCAGCYIAVIRRAREIDAETVSFEQGSDVKLLGLGGGSHEARTRKFIFIPIVFVLLRVWGTVNRGYQMLAGTEEGLSGFNQLQALGDPAQGFVNALFFGILTQPVRRSWRGCAAGCCVAVGGAGGYVAPREPEGAG